MLVAATLKERLFAYIMSDLNIRLAVSDDVPEIMRIYNHAVLNSTATFDIEPKTIEDRMEWFSNRSDKSPVVVAEIDGRIAGWAEIRPFGRRPAYRFTVENAVYIDLDYQGRGIGFALMQEILRLAVEKGFHSMLALVVGGNIASDKLHAKLGFEMVGRMREVGYKFDCWLDVLIYERIL